LVNEVVVLIANKAETANDGYKFPVKFKIYLASIFILSLGTLPTAVLLFRTKDVGFLIASIPLFYMIYNLSYAIFSIPAGKAADKIGAGKIIFIGYIFLIAGYVALGLSQTLIPLIISFLLLGTFSGFTDGMQRAYVSNIIEKEHKGRAFGYLNAVVGFGLLFSGIIGGYLWQNLGDSFTLSVAGTIVFIGLIVLSLTKIAPDTKDLAYKQ
jgi:MFS family permease